MHVPGDDLSPGSAATGTAVAAAAAAPILLELGAKQGNQHPLLLELRRNTAPPEFPGAVRTPVIKGPTLRRSEMVVAGIGCGVAGGQGQGPLTHSASA